MTTFYQYGPISKGSSLLSYYSKVEAEEQPENSTTYEPTPAGPGRLSYWNGSSWHNLPDVRSASLETRKAYALKIAAIEFEAALGSIHSGYTAAERQSWPQQLTDAKAVISDDSSSPPLLSALAAAAGVDIKTFSQKVLSKHDSYLTAYAKLLATYQTQKATINKATQIDQLGSLTYQDLLIVLNG
jgi:hypothetical protein